MAVAVITLSLIVAGQWLLIWRLTDRLLMQAHIPQLGPVRTIPPERQDKPEPTRKKLFSVPLND